MKTTKMDYREKIQFVRSQYLKGEITLEQAKEVIAPWLERMNERGQEIAKEFGKKFKPFTFNYVFR